MTGLQEPPDRFATGAPWRRELQGVLGFAVLVLAAAAASLLLGG